MPVAAADLRVLAGVQAFVKEAPVTLVFVADTTRMKGAPHDMQQTYAWADAAFLSQNVYLFCASSGLATGVRAMVDRPPLAKALKLAPTQLITMAQSVGYPKKPWRPRRRAKRPGWGSGLGVRATKTSSVVSGPSHPSRPQAAPVAHPPAGGRGRPYVGGEGDRAPGIGKTCSVAGAGRAGRRPRGFIPSLEDERSTDRQGLRAWGV